MENERHICEVCHSKYATNFVKFNINGKTVERWMCSDCAKQLNTSGDWLKDFFQGGAFEAMILGNPLEHRERPKKRVCPVCGATEDEIAANYKFGCSECYNVFYDLARSYVSQLGGGEYKGRGPSVGAQSTGAAEEKKAEMTREEKIADLRDRMHAAAKEGDDILAQKLKIQLGELTGGGNE